MQVKQPHVYKNIFGWFDFEDLYDYVIDKTEYNAHFVEVGVFLGKSLSYLLIESAASGKNIQVDGVDDFSVITHEYKTKNLKEEFWQNVYQYKLDNLLNDFHELPSNKAIHQYKKESLDFVFLDYTLESGMLLNDLPEWLRKIKPGGFLAGHDGQYLKHAVDRFFDKKEVVWMGSNENPSWLFRKE